MYPFSSKHYLFVFFLGYYLTFDISNLLFAMKYERLIVIDFVEVDAKDQNRLDMWNF